MSDINFPGDFWKRGRQEVVEGNDSEFTIGEDKSALDETFENSAAKMFLRKKFGLGASAAGGIVRFIIKSSGGVAGFDITKKLRHNIDVLADVVKAGRIGEIDGVGFAISGTQNNFKIGLDNFGTPKEEE